MEAFLGSSPSSNASLPPAHHSSHNSSHGSITGCLATSPAVSIFAAFAATNLLLLLPLSIYVLYLGFRRKQRRGDAAATSADVFAYHMVAMEMIGLCGAILGACGAASGRQVALWAGSSVFAIISCVKMIFHVLTCVERYLAIVHPTTYLRLSRQGGVMIRNVSVGGVWLICCGLMALRMLTTSNFNMILFFCSVGFAITVTSFCSLSVLRVLIRPGPGEGGGDRGGAGSAKQRACRTITAILGVLLFRLSGNLVCFAVAVSSVLSADAGCAVKVSGVWFCFPSGYVLPLLFLQRAGKLGCFHNTDAA